MTTAVKTTRKVNQTSDPDVEKVVLKDLDQDTKNSKGAYVGTHTSPDKEDAAKAKLQDGLGKNLTVQTVSGGRMHYFIADLWITGRPTVVPDSSWLQFQIESGRIKKVE